MPFHPVRVAKKPLKIAGCEKCGLNLGHFFRQPN
jgi:hypothetical protein